MQSVERQFGLPAVLGLLATFAFLLITGCNKPFSGTLEDPSALHAPYASEQLWAVAPLANESGTTAVNRILISDLLAEEIQHINGVNIVPVNRVLLAMQRLGMNAVTSPQDARDLIDILGINGLIVGTITAWDPYQPPKLGLAIQLFTANSLPKRSDSFDPETVRRATRESTPAAPPARPVAQAAGIWDASNHRTLYSLQSYTHGRTRLDSAYGPDLYLVDMDLYTQFVAYRLVEKLLINEHSRLAAAPEP
jgi:hypothetical protein